MEQHAQTAALRVEEAEIAAMVLAPEGLNKTAAKKLVEGCFYECGSAYAELEDFAKLLGVEDPEKAEEAAAFMERAEAAVTKYLRSKSFTPFESMGRLQLAYYLTEGLNNPAILFESGACKPVDFPVHHNVYQDRLAEAAKRETARLERAATAAAEAAKSEEDAA